MAVKSKDGSGHDTSEATTKLSRLLETEIELETMLKDTRRKAKELVEAAQVAADDRIKQLESQLAEEEAELRERIGRDRDRAISSIQNEAQQETARLDELDDAKLTELAQHVVDLLVGPSDSRGPH
jgi:F0F1-type ATP synthase membrane subunit b/b'